VGTFYEKERRGLNSKYRADALLKHTNQADAVSGTIFFIILTV